MKLVATKTAIGFALRNNTNSRVSLTVFECLQNRVVGYQRIMPLEVHLMTNTLFFRIATMFANSGLTVRRFCHRMISRK